MADNFILVSNIKALAQKQRKKIGDIERVGGVQQGFISRLSHKPERSISADFLQRVADYLNVDMETLMSENLEDLSKDEMKVMNFIHHLKVKTISGDLVWQTFTDKQLSDAENALVKDISLWKERNGEIIKDNFYKNSYAVLINDSTSKVWLFHLFHRSNDLNHLPSIDMKLSHNSWEYTLIGLQNVENNRFTVICDSSKCKRSICDEIDNLTRTIDMCNANIHIDEESKTVIDQFMNN